MPQSRPTRALFAAIAVAFAAPLTANAEDAALFTQHDATSVVTVDNTAYSSMIEGLTAIERGRPLVAYEIARAEARPFFTQYASFLEGVPVSQLNRDEQLAFWLNTRNVLLIKAAVDENRIRRYKKLRGTPDAPGAFWTEPRITIDGTPLSLQDIEENILFAGWDDPNIMFGLYQGSKGGPALPLEPFSGATVHQALAEAGERFTADSRNFRVRGDSVRISTYFDWYASFAYDGDETALRSHLASFADEDARTAIAETATLSRKSFSTDFEQYRVRQVNVDLGGRSSSGAGGFGS
ncbi:MAG: DUF547 domain-containing protein [Pseudomonadota bacterium]